MATHLVASSRLALSRTSNASRVALTRGHATAIPVYRDEVKPSTSNVKRWTKQDISDIYHGPLLPLVVRAAGVHATHHDATKIQLATLMNIKSTWYFFFSVSFINYYWRFLDVLLCT